MNRRAIVGLSLAFALLAGVLAGCGNVYEKNTQPYSDEYGASDCESGVVAENDRFQLLWDGDSYCAILYDTLYERIYSTTPYDFYSEGVYEGAAAMSLYSPMTVTYLSAESGNLRDAHALADSIDAGGAAATVIDGGVRLTYAFPDLHFSVAMDLILTDDGLELQIPREEIREEDNLIFEIAVLPYFMAALNDSDSYLFVPSGGGALMNVHALNKPETYSEAIYGEDATEPITMQTHKERQAYLPVFGVKDRENGMLAVVDKGAESARVNAVSGDAEIGYSGVYASFRIRGQEEVTYSNMTNNNVAAHKYSDIITDEPYLSVRYIPMDDDVTYNGMAARYRAYLLAEGALAEPVASVPALSVDLLGGTQIRRSFFGIPYQADTATTTLQQAQKIVEELQTLVGDGQMVIKLSGFGAGGLSNSVIGGNFRLSSVVGGEKALAALQKQAADAGNMLAMDYELMRFQKGGAGFSALYDSTFSVSRLKAKERTYVLNTAVERAGGLSWYLLSRSKLTNAMERAVAAANKSGFTAVSFNSLSHIAYSDYRTVGYSAKAHMAQDVTALLQQSRDSGLAVVATTPNLYAAVAADVITETPLYSSRFSSLDREIPFYTMVFQGYKPLTSPAINTAADVAETYLRAVATGMTLQFTLCDTLHSALQHETDTAYISSRYADWADTIASMVKESAAVYEQIGGQPITSYEEANGVSHTVFDNGVQIAVNYTDVEQDSPLGTVPARSFVCR